MGSVVRRLKPGDLEPFRQLLKLFGDVFGEPHTYIDRQPGDAYLDQLLNRDAFIALVALEGENLVGGLAAYELHKFEQERSEIYIYDLAVSASHRRRGVATALIDQLQPIARDCGAWVIYVQADRGDAPAVALYSKLGVREDVLHFDIEV